MTDDKAPHPAPKRPAGNDTEPGPDAAVEPEEASGAAAAASHRPTPQKALPGRVRTVTPTLAELSAMMAPTGPAAGKTGDGDGGSSDADPAWALQFGSNTGPIDAAELAQYVAQTMVETDDAAPSEPERDSDAGSMEEAANLGPIWHNPALRRARPGRVRTVTPTGSDFTGPGAGEKEAGDGEADAQPEAPAQDDGSNTGRLDPAALARYVAQTEAASTASETQPMDAETLARLAAEAGEEE